MAKDLKDIAAEALELPLTARPELASQRLDSPDQLTEEESDPLWAQEAERRYAEYKTGNIEAVRLRRCLHASARERSEHEIPQTRRS